MNQDDWLAGTISLVGVLICLVLIALHGLFPDDFTVDDHTIALVVAALLFLLIPILPTLARHLKTLSLPGGIRADFRDALVEATETLQRAQIIQPKPVIMNLSVPDVSLEVSDPDPNIRVAGLAIGLEKTLRLILEQLDISHERASLRKMSELLEEHGVISVPQGQVLRDITALRNRAVHGADVSSADATLFANLVKDFLKSLLRGPKAEG